MNVPAVQRPAEEYAIDIFVRGDFAKFTPAEEAQYLRELCHSLGLNPLTRPFEFINFQGRRIPYVRRDGTDQLRKRDGVSVIDLTETERDGVFIVTAKVQNRDGRTDMAKGAVNINGAKGEVLANLLMKAETKAKRRATLSICGLGFLDETEVDESPEKLTKPKEESKHTRAAQAEIDWNKKFAEWKRIIRSFTMETELRQWWNDKAPERSVFPPHMIKELRETADSQKDFIRSATPQVVHDTDDMEPRPATPEDFDPATGEIKDDPLDLIRA